LADQQGHAPQPFRAGYRNPTVAARLPFSRMQQTACPGELRRPARKAVANTLANAVEGLLPLRTPTSEPIASQAEDLLTLERRAI